MSAKMIVEILEVTQMLKDLKERLRPERFPSIPAWVNSTPVGRVEWLIREVIRLRIENARLRQELSEK